MAHPPTEMWASAFPIAAPLAMRAMRVVASEEEAPRSDLESGVAEVASFEAIYDEYFDFVWRSARRLGVWESAVDDVVQDVFVVVYRRLADFERRSTIKTWLFGIVLRVARTHRRTAARKRAEPLPEGLASSGLDPQAESERRQAIDVLDAILDRMDEDKRVVFVMAELEQMTAPEIAAVTDTKLNTVYSRLRAARKVFEEGVKRHRARDERGKHE